MSFLDKTGLARLWMNILALTETCELVTVDDIDEICGTTIQVVNANDSEVTF